MAARSPSSAAGGRGRGKRSDSAKGKPLPPVVDRYAGATAVVDTGASATKAAKRAEARQPLERKKGELFARISHAMLATEVAARMGGGGETAAMLLLDCRSEEDFARWHIATAMPYPMERLSRANAMTLDLLNFMGKEGKRIVVYDTDEVRAAYTANNLCERGGMNTVLLAGGLFTFSEQHPELIEGVPIARPKSAASAAPASSSASRGTPVKQAR